MSHIIGDYDASAEDNGLHGRVLNQQKHSYVLRPQKPGYRSREAKRTATELELLHSVTGMPSVGIQLKAVRKIHKDLTQ
jgi:hypothetical protein